MKVKRQKRCGLSAVLTAVVVFLLAMEPVAVNADCFQAPTGIISWWAGDGNATDIVSGYDGTEFFDATYDSGLVDKGFSFDGQDDVVWVFDTEPINELNVLTIEAWVKMNDLHLDRIQRFVTITGEKAVLRCDFGELQFYIRKASGEDLASVRYDGLVAGTWCHVAGTYDGITMRLYLNGEEVQSLETTGPLFYNTYQSAVELSSEIEPLDGLLDEVSIYNRALTAEEISSIYQSGFEGKCKPEIAVSPLVLDFGQVDLDTVSPALSVTISNAGPGTLTVNTISLREGSSEDFILKVPSLPLSMGPMTSYDLLAKFTPSTLGASSGILEIVSDDPDEPVIEVSLQGIGVVTDEKDTPAGEEVIVELVDLRNPLKKKIAVKFTKVIDAGKTKMTIKKPALEKLMPEKMKLLTPEELYEIETTAKVEGPIEVAIDYSDKVFIGSEKKLKIYHKKINEPWKDITLLVDMLEKEVKGTADSFSDFGIFELDTFALINGLINDVLMLNLQQGIQNSLDAKLNAALKAVDDYNAYNDIAAINTLDAFIAAVLAQSDNKIPIEDAEALIATAQEIILALSDQ